MYKTKWYHSREPPKGSSSAKSFQNSEKGENNKMNKAKKAFTRAFAVLLVKTGTGSAFMKLN